MAIPPDGAYAASDTTKGNETTEIKNGPDHATGEAYESMAGPRVTDATQAEQFQHVNLDQIMDEHVQTLAARSVPDEFRQILADWATRHASQFSESGHSEAAAQMT